MLQLTGWLLFTVWQVLYLVDPIDEVALSSVGEYKNKKFVDISKEDLELGKTLGARCQHDIFVLVLSAQHLVKHINVVSPKTTPAWSREGIRV